MDDGFNIPGDFEEATELWNNLGRKMANGHLRRAQLVTAILDEPTSEKCGRVWTAVDLGKEWGVTGERIRRYIRTVKVFGEQAEGVLSLPGMSWTHIEEISRLPDPKQRESFLQTVQDKKLSSNATKREVSILLGAEGGASQVVSLPILLPATRTVVVPITEHPTFRDTMEILAEWATRAAAGLRALRAKIGPDGLYAADLEDQMAASGARNELDDLRDAILDIRPLLNHSIPPPEPKTSVLISVEPHPEASAGRVLEL